MLSTLTPPADWEHTKTEEQRAELLNTLRNEEMKWAKRSLLALIALFVLVAILAVVLKLFVFH